jgi:hypothetical protein
VRKKDGGKNGRVRRKGKNEKTELLGKNTKFFQKTIFSK